MTERIRAAMLIQRYYPHIGGAERQLAALAPLLQAQGVQIHILTRRYHPNLAPFEIIDDVPVHRLPMPGPKAMASLSFTLAALPLLRGLRLDIIHAYELLSPTTTAVAAKRLCSVPVVAKVLRGGVLGDLAKLKRKPFGKQRIATFRKQVNAFIAISREIDAELAEIGVPPARRLPIPNGVDTARFAPLPPEEKPGLRASLGLPNGPIAIFTGRLAAEKRLDQLISIWPAVRAVHPEAVLLLLGSGRKAEETALRRIAGAGVQFMGRVEDVAPYLQCADLFVLPSATEGLSNALLEALATGLPAIATSVGGTPDVITHGHNGWLVSPAAPAALQDAVLTLLGNADIRTRLGRRGRERVVHDYALTVVAERLRATYDRLIAPRPTWTSNYKAGEVRC